MFVVSMRCRQGPEKGSTMHAQFAVHMLTDDGKRKAQEIAEAFEGLLTKLEEVCPDGRHLALVRTNLETACFYAKKAMAEQNSQ